MDSFVLENANDNQGSTSWLNETANSVGGSSVHGLISNPALFLVNRLTDERSFSNIAMDFGSLFENVIRVHLAKLIGSTIHVLGAVPFLRNDEGKLNAHYSMDGMFTANIHHLKGRDNTDLFPNAEKNYLLEIKTPWSRELKSYKKTTRYGRKGECIIPLMYKDQVKMA